MKRREMIVGLSALASAPLALSFAGSTCAQSIKAMSSVAKNRSAVVMMRLELLALQFASVASAVDVDLLFDVGGKLLPYRVASFRANSVSPTSKLFGLGMDQRALAGFRVELCNTGRSSVVGMGGCSAGVEAGYRLPVAGEYVLDIPNNGVGAAVSPLRPGQRLDDPAWLRGRSSQSFMVFSIGPAAA